MFQKLKLAIKLFPFSCEYKKNLVVVLIMTAVGVLIEVVSHGMNFLGGYFFLISAMFPVQFIFGLGHSNLVGTSTYKKQLQTSIPVIVNFIMSIIIFTILFLIKLLEIHFFPASQNGILSGFLMLGFFEIMLCIYDAFVYKYYWVSILMFAVVFVWVYNCMGNQDTYILGIQQLVSSVSPVGMLLLVYLSVFFGVVLQYVLSLLLYKKPLSKRSQGANIRRQLSA